MREKIALLSVFCKDGIVEFAQALLAMGWNILASGGTAKFLSDAGIAVTDVKNIVGGGPILGHRVVTLSREVHAGLLATHSPEDIAEMCGLKIPFIDLVCVDLYPLIDEINREGSTPHSVIEKTDIGGPTMLRSGAKGQRPVICDPADRMRVIEWMRAGCPNEYLFIRALAAKAEYVISNYCLASASYQGNGKYQGFIGELKQECKYGENAYQSPAGLYSTNTTDPLALDKFEIVAGESPSYNNLVDVDRLLQTVTRIAASFKTSYGEVPAIAVGVKHGNACGASIGLGDGGIALSAEIEALEGMIVGDPLALFGGLVMVNFPIGLDEAKTLLNYETISGKRRILDGIVAPNFTAEAIEILQRKNGRCRFLANEALLELGVDSLDIASRFRYVRGGFLMQPNYAYIPELSKAVALGDADPPEKIDVLLAMAICQTSNSNTITLVKNGKLIGNGVGQQSRVVCAELAVSRALKNGHNTNGASAASDSFFPFVDGVQALTAAGIKTIFTTSGSINDNDVISHCQKNHISLYMVPDTIGRGFFNH